MQSLLLKVGLLARNIFPVHGSTDNGKTCFKMKEKLVATNCWSSFLNAFLLQSSNYFERRIMKAVLSTFQDFRIFQQEMHILEICSKNLYRIV